MWYSNRMSFSNPHPHAVRTGLVFALALACIGPAAVGQATTPSYAPAPFEHYQPILDRMPFGAMQPPAAPVDVDQLKNAAQEKAEQQALAKKVNMSCVNITPDGKTAIGFTDLSQNPAVNYYLTVGTAANGWTVVEADYDEETATIEKEGVTVTLKLGQGLVDPAALAAKAAAAPARAVAPAPPAGVPPPNPLLAARPVGIPVGAAAPLQPAARPTALSTFSYRERQQERQTQQTAEQAANEAKQRHLLESLAREAANNEIKRREEEVAAEAAAALEQQQ